MTARGLRVCLTGALLSCAVLGVEHLGAVSAGTTAAAVPTLITIRPTLGIRTTTTRVRRTTTTRPRVSTTATPRRTTTTRPLPSVLVPATVPTTMAGHVHEDEPRCLYRGDLLVSTVDLTAQLGALGLSTPTGEQIPHVDKGVLERMAATNIYPYAVSPGTDPMQLATTLGTQGIVAGPVTMVMPVGHWYFVGDNPPHDLPEPLPEVRGGLSANPAQLAMLDTGFTPAIGDPAWLTRRVKPASSLDADHYAGPSAGHGRFVASVIVQHAPDTLVTVGGITPISASSLRGDRTSTVPAGIDGVSDELQLWMAMERVLGSGKPFGALNLSVGAYSCPGTPSGLAIQAALIRWYRETGGKPVIAAAGNHHPGENGGFPPFIPGQLPGANGPAGVPAFDPALCKEPVVCTPGPLYGVQSVDAQGQQSDFSNDAACAANGEDVLGVRLPGGSASVWSGSSFAAAIVAAAVGAGAPVPCDGTAVESPSSMHRPSS